MVGPCTLLVEPTKQTYTDSLGVHALPWHEIPMIQRRSVPTFIDVDIYHQISFRSFEEKWALSIRQHLARAPVRFNDAFSPDGLSTQAKFSVANGTLSFPSLYDSLYYLKDNVPAVYDRPFWEVLGLSSSHGDGHAGTSYVAKVVSAGGDCDIYESANADSASVLANLDGLQYFAVVANPNNASREFRFFADAKEFAPSSHTSVLESTALAPYEYAEFMHNGYHYPAIPSLHVGFTAGQRIGVRFKDTAVGEVFYLIMFSVVGGKGTQPTSPLVPLVRTTTADVPNTYWYDPNGLNPIQTFAAASWVTQARMGETFWRCPITADHIPDDTSFSIASRTLPLYKGRLSTARFGLWEMCRAQALYTDPASEVAMQATMSIAKQTADGPIISSVSVATHTGDVDDGFAKLQSANSLVAQREPRWAIVPDVTLASLKSGLMNVRSSAGVGDSGIADKVMPGWMRLDDENLEQLYLFPGTGFLKINPGDTGEFTEIMSRDHAIFNRDLTAAEYAFLNDPKSVWSINMFAEPRAAAVSGLEEPLYRGDDRTIVIVISDVDGNSVPLFGHTVWFTAKAIPSLADADDTNAALACVVSLSGAGEVVTQSGLVASDPAAGQVTFAFTLPFVANNPVLPSGTIRYTVTTPMQWDVQVRDASNSVRTLATGRFDLASDVTRLDTAV